MGQSGPSHGHAALPLRGAFSYTHRRTQQGPKSGEDLATDGLLPMPYFEAEYFCGDFTFGAAGGIFAGHFGDSDGRYWDLESYGIWHFDRDFDMRAGYRYLVLDGDGRATSRDFDAAVDVQGFYVTFGYLF